MLQGARCGGKSRRQDKGALNSTGGPATGELCDLDQVTP